MKGSGPFAGQNGRLFILYLLLVVEAQQVLPTLNKTPVVFAVLVLLGPLLGRPIGEPFQDKVWTRHLEVSTGVLRLSK